MKYRLNDLLQKMVDLEGTDLYVASDARPLASVHGKLVDLGDDYLGPDDSRDLASAAMSAAQASELEKHLELNLAYKCPAGRFRFNIYFQRGTVALVARHIRTDIPSSAELGLPDSLNRIVMAERGIVLVTGATGSGKSTTLAALIDYRNANSSGHIVTIEDPIEFVHEHKSCIISQREVGIDTQNFHEALKSALRQAPKVILIGEIRDSETAAFAMHAADTGHLVLATLHTNSANQTIERIVNLFPPEQERPILLQLSLNLRAIICQRLVPKVGGGRAAAIEVLLNTSRVQELIQQGAIQELKTAMNKGGSEGMQTFDMALMNLVKSGAIDEETALKFADSANDLKLRLRGFM